MPQKETLLVTVRTYPNISSKYVETVCTAGVTRDGEWRRLYPVALRYLDDGKKYSTYDIIEVSVEDGKDGRPETRRPNCQTINVVGRANKWDDRCGWIKKTIFPSLEAMKQAKRTIGPVAAREVKSFEANQVSTDWSAKQLELMKQDGLFKTRKPLQKIPFDFRFRWVDHDGAEHDSKALAWEFGETWRRYSLKYPDPIPRMREKWMNDICSAKNQISFYLGNSAEHRNAFMICGIFFPPKKVSDSDHLF